MTLIIIIHRKLSENQRSTFEWKSDLLVRMNLKSLVFDVTSLQCPMGCCRETILETLCCSMAQEGPWYRKKPNPAALCRHDGIARIIRRGQKVPEIAQKLQTDVRVDGVYMKRDKDVEKQREDDGEADYRVYGEDEIFIGHWGLDAACCRARKFGSSLGGPGEPNL